MHGSHPLGWVRRWRITVHDQLLTDEDYLVVLHGQPIGPANLPTVRDIWWHRRGMLTIRIPEQPLPQGPPREAVDLDLSTFFFTPEIDHEDAYSTFPLALRATPETEPTR